MRDVEKRYETERNADKQVQLGYYIEEAKKVLADPRRKKSVVNDLKQVLDPGNLAKLALGPERVLRSAQVVVNDSLLTEASYKAYDTNAGRMCDLSINLTSEGSDRLWAYSKGRVGTQLLLVADGVAIAAPRIGFELAQSNYVITQMPEERLVKQAVDAINKHGAK